MKDTLIVVMSGIAIGLPIIVFTLTFSMLWSMVAFMVVMTISTLINETQGARK